MIPLPWKNWITLHVHKQVKSDQVWASKRSSGSHRSCCVYSIDDDVYDLILFLLIQTYKKIVPRTHKDAASAADVWSSTSAFDGIFINLLPLQLTRSDHRLVPSQADEEAH